MASSSESGHAVNIAHLKLLADTCAGFGIKYNPSNDDITVVNLKAKWTTVTAGARIDRDHGLYDTDSGVIDLAKACKQYVKALFGATSAEAKLVKGIKFSPKKK